MDIPFNLLILPFLGGYIFVRFWYYTRIHILRSDKDRVIIRAAIAGLFFLVVSYTLSIVVDVLPCKYQFVCSYQAWKAVVPFEYAGVSLGAFVIAALAWVPMNWFTSTEKEVDRAINEDADPLELMLKRSQDEGILIAVTLTNEKVYIGWVSHQFNPATPTNNIGIFPLLSGYRDPLTKRMHLKINYSDAYQKINERLGEIEKEVAELESEIKRANKKPKVDIDQDHSNQLFQLHDEWDDLEFTINLFLVVIPVCQISSSNFYDKEVHSRYFLKAEHELIEP